MEWVMGRGNGSGDFKTDQVLGMACQETWALYLLASARAAFAQIP